MAVVGRAARCLTCLMEGFFCQSRSAPASCGLLFPPVLLCAVQVSQASKSAREAVERAGGSVTTVYYNKLGLR